jgi:hypothetical protein
MQTLSPVRWGRRGIVIVAVAVVAATLGSTAVRAAAGSSLRPGGPPRVGPYLVLSGSLHDHTTDSDGDTSSAVVADWLKTNHRPLGIDFDTLTDHSDFFPEALGSPTTPDPWTRQADLSRTHTGDGFSLLRGFEVTNDQENHLNVIGSQNWTSRWASEPTLQMAPFWQWLSANPVNDPSGRGLGFGGGDGAGQFNHPGDKGALNWDDYRFDPAAAAHMDTIEVHGGQSLNAGDLAGSDAGWYWFALSQGWTLSPTMNWDWHTWTAKSVVTNPNPGAACGADGYLPCQRTVVLATDNSPAAILEALKQRRTSASELPDLWATLRGPNGAWQGSTVAAEPGSTITLTVDAGAAQEQLQQVDIVSDAGVSPYPYYYGDNAPCDVTQAPDPGDPTQNCDPENFSHSQLSISYAEQHRRYVTSGGHATRKARIDQPPAGTVVAQVPLTGHRASTTITVRVPDAPSSRPDGKHFFYAVVHASVPGTVDTSQSPDVTARAWTGPLLTAGEPQGTWVAGDTHVHDDHSSDGSLPRQSSNQQLPGNLSVGDQVGQAERNGLGFLPLTDHRTYDQQWDPQWTSSKLVLVPGEEANGSPHATVIGATDELVDGANPPGSAAYRHIQQSVWDVHAQDGSWGTAHPDDGETNSDGSPNANASTIGPDTIEVWNKASNPDAEIDYAESRWNRGFRTGVAGASDDHFKEVWPVGGPGDSTTWVFASDPHTQQGIVDGIRAGRTTVSASPTGAFVTLEADLNGDGLYEAIDGDEDPAAPGTPGWLRVRVKRAPGSTVLVYASPGRSAGPIATFTPASLDDTFRVPIVAGPAWYRVEVRGAGGLSGIAESNTDLSNQLLAVASPIFVDTGAAASPEAEMPLPAPSGLTDSAQVALGNPGDFTGFPDVAQSAGLTHVVAETHRGSNTTIEYRRLDSSGKALGPPVDLAPNSGSARFPRIAAGGRDVWVVWQDERQGQAPHQPVVYVRHSADSGNTWDPEQVVSTGTGRAEHPTVTAVMGPAGRVAAIAWADNSSGAFDIMVDEMGVDRTPVDVSGEGKTISAGVPADSRSPRYPASLFPSLAADGNGRLAVAWADDRFDPDPLWTGHTGAGAGTDPDDWEILAVARKPGAAWSKVAVVSRDPQSADRHPSIVFDDSGRLTAAWDTKALHSSGINVSLRWAQSADGGMTWSSWQDVAVDSTAMSERPRLTVDGDGPRLVWYDSRSSDWRWSVWTSQLRSGAWSTATRVTGDGNATYPAVAGRTVVFTSDRMVTRPQRDRTEAVYAVTVP